MHKLTERPWTSRLTHCLAVAAVCSTTVMGGGCKSSMPTWKTPSWNSFGFKKEPSPDALAGVGPTATYPISPSAGVTPSAIQSVAASPAGVQPQTAQVAASTNPAAAAANGFAGQPATGPAVAPGTSYVYGKSPATPTTAGPTAVTPTYATTAAAARPPASNYSAVGYPMPGTPSTAPAAGPVSASIASGPMPSTPSSAATTGGSATPPSLAGFAMPAGVTAPAGSAAPSTGGFVMPAQTATAQTSANPPTSGFVMPTLGGTPVEEESTPETRTASASGSPTTSPGSGVSPAGAYAPGSTSGATTYPATSAGGTTDSGSFYR